MPQAQYQTDQYAAGGRSLWSDARRRLVRDKSALICLLVIALYALVAIGATAYDFIADWSDTDGIVTFKEMVDYENKNHPPSFANWKLILGTDWAGRSILVKTVLGAKVSMAVGLISNLIAVPLGLILGAIAGYFGGKLDSVIVWSFSTLASIPGIVLLIAIKAAFKDVPVLSGIYGVYIALGVVSWIGACRLIRAETLKLRELDYVLAARASGRSGLAIMFHHIIPNVLHLGIICFSLGFVGAVQSEVILSYLGLGVKVGTPSWGTMIDNARMDLFAGRWWELTAAVAAMFFLVLALNIFGDRLRDALDPKLRNV